MEDEDPLIAIVDRPIDLRDAIAAVAGPDAGAVSVFLGTVRGSTQGRGVLFLEYEAYTPMAEAKLREAVRIRPQYATALLNLARVYRQKGRKDLARHFFEQAKTAIHQSGEYEYLLPAIETEEESL